MNAHPPYRMPAEWEPHEAMWIGWPVNPDDWPGKLPAVEWVFVEMVRFLAPGEQVHILVPNGDEEARVARLLAGAGVEAGRVTFHQLRTDRNWLRDSGAIFVREPGNNTLRALHFGFNAWAKYDNYELDRHIPPLMAEVAGTPLERPVLGSTGDQNKDWFILEGGSIDVNGAGLLLTTEECLLGDSQIRNPGATKEELERALQRYLGADGVIWLGKGIEGDDTGGHVDDIARFVAERTVVALEPQDDSDTPEKRHLADNLERLRAWRDDAGGLEVVPIPMPEPLVYDDTRLPASYANFTIGNEVVLVPTFNDPMDRIALGILQECFRDRTVRGLHAVDLVWGFGAAHCLTQQQPR